MVTVWLGIMVVLLVAEFITMELYGACGAIGALAGFIVMLFDLPLAVQIVAAVVVAGTLVVLARPIGMKYINQIRKESRMQNLVGADAIVIRTINSAKGMGMVTIDGKAWSAKSHRPNAVIEVGQVVKVVAMQNNTAIVDDRRRNRG